MPRHRKPLSKAIVDASTLRNPGRYAGRTSPAHPRPLGRPYAQMTAAEQECWREFEQSLPWLKASHRLLVRLACRLAARLDSEQFGLAATKALGSILSKLGATPTDANRVAQRGEEDGDDERFFGRSH